MICREAVDGEELVIRDWSLVLLASNPYAAPESARRCLNGLCLRPDGEERRVNTSEIVASSRRVVTTRSGSRYRLGAISRKYRKYLSRECPEWNYREPLRGVAGK